MSEKNPRDEIEDILKKLEADIAKEYAKAAKDLKADVEAFKNHWQEQEKEYQILVDAGEMSAEDFKQWRLNQIARQDRLEKLAEKCAGRVTRATEIANVYINDVTPSVYALERNYTAYKIGGVAGGDWIALDETTVRKLIVEKPDVMPHYPIQRAIDRGINLAFGKSEIRKAVTSGIIMGKSCDKIAGDIMKRIETMDYTASIRAARTAVTNAQNSGAQDSLEYAEKIGLNVAKKWTCIHDARTREAHQFADGQLAKPSAPFIVEGEFLMFPGDGSMGASGWNLYNCRCALDEELIDFPYDKPYETYTEWKERITDSYNVMQYGFFQAYYGGD